MALSRLFRSDPQRAAAYRLYGAIVGASRQPWFFAEGGVPDTLDGRFEVIALHAVLVFRRLNQDHAATKDFAQQVFDAMFADLDRALREMGTGDLSVGKQVKRMVAGFYGRARAYERGLAAGDDELADALRRNLFGTAEPRPEELASMVGYVRAAAPALDGQPVAALVAGEVQFPATGA
jgi:cytochrome b pre-mRNA-processing protein 3